MEKSNPTGNDRNAAGTGPTGTHHRTRAQSDCKSPSPLLSFAQISFYRSVFYQCVSVQLFTELFTLLHAHSPVTHESHSHVDWHVAQDFKVCVVRIKTSSSPCHPWCRMRIHLHPRTWAFHLCLPIPQPHLHLRLRCRSTNTSKIHKMKSVALWPIQPLPRVINVIDNFDNSETLTTIFQNEFVHIDSEPSYSCDAELGRWAYQKSAIFTTVQIRSKKNQRTWDKLVFLMKEVCYQLSLFFTRTKFKFVSNNGNQVATWKTNKSGFSLKDIKSKFLLKSESRSTNFKPSLTEESIQELTVNSWFSANGNWSYYYKSEHFRRDQ